MAERSTPLYRVRIAHTKTIKNGWDYESSVEITQTRDDELSFALERQLEELLVLARVLGERERNIRNQRDHKEDES